MTTFASEDTPLGIPDRGTVESTINVPEVSTVTDIKVTVDISHSRDQDLDVYLIGPDGTQVELFTDVGGDGDNFQGTTLDDEADTSITQGSAPFSGSYQPEGSLADFQGRPANGTWRLRVTDDKQREVGMLNSWSIEMPYVQPTISISDATATEGDQSIEFIDAFVSSDSQLLDHPKGMVLHDGHLYVNSSWADSVVRFDGVTGEFVDFFVPTGSGGIDNPIDLLFGPDGNLYVSSPVGATGPDAPNAVLRYDGTNGDFMGEFIEAGSGGLLNPRDLEFDADGFLYVTCGNTHQVLRYNASGAFEGVFISAFSGGLDGPRGLEFGPDGNLYVAGMNSDNVLRFDGQTGEFIDEFVAAGSGGLDGSADLLFGPDGDLYATSWLSDSVLRFDGGTGQFVEAVVPLGGGGLDGPRDLFLGPDGNFYVASIYTNEVLRYGPASQMALTVTRSGSRAEKVSVEFEAVDNEAVEGDDYAPSSGTVVFDPGVTTRTIIVPTMDDPDQEGDETFFVDLTNPSAGATIADSRGECTIVDDDSPAPPPNALYVYDIRFESTRDNRDWRAVFEIRSDSDLDGQGTSADAVAPGVEITVTFAGNTYTGTTDADGVFRTSWIKNLGSGDHYANAVDLVLTDYVWDPLMDLEDDSDGDGYPDDLLSL